MAHLNEKSCSYRLIPSCQQQCPRYSSYNAIRLDPIHACHTHVYACTHKIWGLYRGHWEFSISEHEGNKEKFSIVRNSIRFVRMCTLKQRREELYYNSNAVLSTHTNTCCQEKCEVNIGLSMVRFKSKRKYIVKNCSSPNKLPSLDVIVQIIR